MPIYAPTTGEILSRRQYLANLRGGVVSNVPTGPSLHDVLTAGQTGLMLAEPIAGGIAEHMRQGREADLLAEQQAEQAQRNEAAIVPERAALDNARARGVQMLAERNMPAGGDNGYGQAVPDTTDAFKRLWAANSQTPENTQAIEQMRSALNFQMPETGMQVFGESKDPMQVIAQRRVAPKMVRPMAPIEHTAPVPEQPLATPVQPQDRTGMEIGRRITEAMPQQNQGNNFMGLEQLRAEAHKAALSNNPEHKQRVLEQLTQLGDAAYAPQGWAEIFNPSLAQKRVLQEFHQILNPAHGMNPLEMQYKMAQIANTESQRTTREAETQRKASAEPARVEALQAVAALNKAKLPKAEYDAEIAKIRSQMIEEQIRSGIDKDVAIANANNAMAGLNVTRTGLAPRDTAAHEKSANAQMLGAQANVSRANTYKRLADVAGGGGAGGSKAPANPLSPALEAVHKEVLNAQLLEAKAKALDEAIANLENQPKPDESASNAERAQYDKTMQKLNELRKESAVARKQSTATLKAARASHLINKGNESDWKLLLNSEPDESHISQLQQQIESILAR